MTKTAGPKQETLERLEDGQYLRRSDMTKTQCN